MSRSNAAATRGIPPRFSRIAAEAVAGLCGDDHVEDIPGVVSMCGRARQRADEVMELVDGVGPAVHQQQRQGLGALPAEPRN
jgi:hypothetical protein